MDRQTAMEMKDHLKRVFKKNFYFTHTEYGIGPNTTIWWNGKPTIYEARDRLISWDNPNAPMLKNFLSLKNRPNNWFIFLESFPKKDEPIL